MMPLSHTYGFVQISVDYKCCCCGETKGIESRNTRVTVLDESLVLRQLSKENEPFSCLLPY